MARMAASHSASLVVFPELSLTGYDRSLKLEDALGLRDSRLRPLQRTARENALTVVAGAPLASAAGLHIGAIIFHPDGTLGRYEKQYLHEGEEVAFAPGAGGDSFFVAHELVGVAICAEVSYPERARAISESGASIYAASCFYTCAGYAYSANLLAGYAKEHEFLVLLSNYAADLGEWSTAGGSAAWSAGGHLLATAPRSGEALVIAARNDGVWTGEVVVF